jgi:hypothetical protein
MGLFDFLEEAVFNPNSAIAFGMPFANASVLGSSGGHIGPPLRTPRLVSANANARLLEAFAKSAQSQSRFSG